MSDNRGARDDDDRSAWLSGLSPAAQRLRNGIEAARSRTGDELQRRRIWAGLVGRIPSPPRARFNFRWHMVLGLAAFILAVGVGTVLGIRATHTVAHRPLPPLLEEAQPLTQDMGAFLEGPAEVHTSGNETMRVRLRGGTRVALGTRTRLLINASHEPELTVGYVRLEVPKQPPGKRFKLKVGPYEVVVLGTRFSVDINRENVAVQVEEGVVEVVSADRKVTLRAGQNWTGWLLAGAGQPQPPPEGMKGPPRPTAKSFAGAPRSPASLPPSSSRTSFQFPPEEAPRSDNTPAMPRPSVDLAKQARQALAAGDPDRALALLEALAQRSGPAAENASYELGRVWLLHKQQPRRALMVWQRYQQEHPRGLLRAEVDLSVVETLANIGETKSATVEAEAFLRRYPGSERRAEVEKLLKVMRAHSAGGAPP